MIYLLIGKQCLFPAVVQATADEEGVMMETSIEWSKTATMVYDELGKAEEMAKSLSSLSGKELFVVALRDFYEYKVFEQMSQLFYEAYCRQFDARAKKSAPMIFSIDDSESWYGYMKAISYYPWEKYRREKGKHGKQRIAFAFPDDRALMTMLADILKHGYIRTEEERYGVSDEGK